MASHSIKYFFVDEKSISFFTWIIMTMKQKLVSAIRIGLKNVKHELALKVFPMEEKYRLVSGMPNPNFQNQEFSEKNQESIRRFFISNQEENQEIFYEISKVIKLNSNGLTQVLTCLINANTPIHFATE